jgi:hypothetical protein
VLARSKELFQPIDAGAPEFAMARNPVGGKPNPIGLQVKSMLPTRDPPRDESGSLEDREMLGDLSGRFGERCRECSYGLVTALTEAGEQSSPGRVTQREEDFVELRFARGRPSFLGQPCASAVSFLSVHHMVYCYPAVAAFARFGPATRSELAIVPIREELD